MTAILLFKIIAAPLLICAATLVSRRWGHGVGGWLTGLPMTSGPVSVFFALDHGSHFARHAAEGTIGGVAVSLVVNGISLKALVLGAPRPAVR